MRDHMDEIEAIINQAIYFGSSVPILGDGFRMVDNYRYYNDYMRSRGLSWADVRYPSRLGSGSSGSLINFVSSNIKDLYGD